MSAQRKELSVREFHFVPTTFDEAKKYADEVANSSLCPQSYKGRPTDILVAWQMGHELGLGKMQALRTIGVINGVPFTYGNGQLALIKRHHQFENSKEWYEGTLEDDTLTAFCLVKRKGKDEVIECFSISDAKRAGLWNKTSKSGEPTPWTKYPRRMLMWRARGYAYNCAFPDVLFGLPSEDEAKEIIEAEVTIVEAKPITKGMSALEETLGLVEEPIEEEKDPITKELNNLIQEKNVPDNVTKIFCTQFNVEKIEQIPNEGKQKIINFLKEKDNAI